MSSENEPKKLTIGSGNRSTKTIRPEDIHFEDVLPPEPVKKAKVQGDELRAIKKENKFYLPVLNINDPTMWPGAKKSDRKPFTDEVAKDVCLSNCCGVPGVKSSCCKMDPDDLEHVLGPLTDEYITKLIRWFRKKNLFYTRHDIVIDYEEGKLIGEKFFAGSRVAKVFEDPKSYPIFRFQVDGPRFSCKFLNNHSGMCTIYEARPDMCRNYYCQFVKNNFLLKTKEHPNSYTMITPASSGDEEENGI
jgi:Fe-S-cluster containining protein